MRNLKLKCILVDSGQTASQMMVDDLIVQELKNTKK